MPADGASRVGTHQGQFSGVNSGIEFWIQEDTSGEGRGRLSPPGGGGGKKWQRGRVGKGDTLNRKDNKLRANVFSNQYIHWLPKQLISIKRQTVTVLAKKNSLM